jgi:hypothetical protein
MRGRWQWSLWIGCSLIRFQMRNWIFCILFVLFILCFVCHWIWEISRCCWVVWCCSSESRPVREEFSDRVHMFLIAGPVQSPCLFMSISPILAQHAGVVSIFDFGVDGSESRVRCYVSLMRFSFPAVLFRVIFGSSHLWQCVLVSPRCTSSSVQGLRFSLGQARLFLLVN